MNKSSFEFVRFIYNPIKYIIVENNCPSSCEYWRLTSTRCMSKSYQVVTCVIGLQVVYTVNNVIDWSVKLLNLLCKWVVFKERTEIQHSKSTKPVQTIFMGSITTVQLGFRRNRPVQSHLNIGIELFVVELLSSLVFCPTYSTD